MRLNKKRRVESWGDKKLQLEPLSNPVMLCHCNKYLIHAYDEFVNYSTGIHINDWIAIKYSNSRIKYYCVRELQKGKTIPVRSHLFNMPIAGTIHHPVIEINDMKIKLETNSNVLVTIINSNRALYLTLVACIWAMKKNKMPPHIIRIICEAVRE